MGFSLSEFAVPKVWLWYGSLGIIAGFVGAWAQGVSFVASIPLGQYVVPAAATVVSAVALGNIFGVPKITK